MKIVYVLLLLVAIVEIGAQRHNRPQRHKSNRQSNRDADYEPVSQLDANDINADNGDDDDNDDDYYGDDDDFKDDLDDNFDEKNIGGGLDDQYDSDPDADNSISAAPNSDAAATASAPTATTSSAPTAGSGTEMSDYSSDDAPSVSARSMSPKPKALHRAQRHQRGHHSRRLMAL